MADDNEVRIKITADAKALAAGFDEATTKLLAFKKSADAPLQATAQQLTSAFDSATKANEKFQTGWDKLAVALNSQKKAIADLDAVNQRLLDGDEKAYTDAINR